MSLCSRASCARLSPFPPLRTPATQATQMPIKKVVSQQPVNSVTTQEGKKHTCS